MIKKSVLLVTTIVFCTLVSAQINENAIGLRLGGSNSYGAEFTYQRGLSNKNRVEVDLGLRSRETYSAFALTGIYQWVWPIQDGFSWYAGPGAQIGAWNNRDNNKYNDEDGGWFAILGQIGAEYQFDFPLQLSLDVRPGIAFGDVYDDVFDIGFSVRYTFR